MNDQINFVSLTITSKLSNSSTANCCVSSKQGVQGINHTLIFLLIHGKYTQIYMSSFKNNYLNPKFCITQNKTLKQLVGKNRNIYFYTFYIQSGYLNQMKTKTLKTSITRKPHCQGTE